MPRQYPSHLSIPCINSECTNLIILELYNQYYSDRDYTGNCSRCGINIRINKFSPVLEKITSTDVLSNSNVYANVNRLRDGSVQTYSLTTQPRKKGMKNDYV